MKPKQQPRDSAVHQELFLREERPHTLALSRQITLTQASCLTGPMCGFPCHGPILWEPSMQGSSLSERLESITLWPAGVAAALTHMLLFWSAHLS